MTPNISGNELDSKHPIFCSSLLLSCIDNCCATSKSAFAFTFTTAVPPVSPGTQWLSLLPLCGVHPHPNRDRARGVATAGNGSAGARHYVGTSVTDASTSAATSSRPRRTSPIDGCGLILPNTPLYMVSAALWSSNDDSSCPMAMCTRPRP